MAFKNLLSRYFYHSFAQTVAEEINISGEMKKIKEKKFFSETLPTFRWFVIINTVCDDGFILKEQMRQTCSFCFFIWWWWWWWSHVPTQILN